MRHKFGWLISLIAGTLMFWLTIYQLLEIDSGYPIDALVINTALVWLVSIFLGTLYLPKLGNITGHNSEMSPLDAIVGAVLVGGLGPLYLLVILALNRKDWKVPKSVIPKLDD